jgi:hypothetical protein
LLALAGGSTVDRSASATDDDLSDDRSVDRVAE